MQKPLGHGPVDDLQKWLRLATASSQRIRPAATEGLPGRLPGEGSKPEVRIAPGAVG
jgi:hypothetical protein